MSAAKLQTPNSKGQTSEHTSKLRAEGKAFFGATYYWPTPNHGKRLIGVAKLRGKKWDVVWFDDEGKATLINKRLSGWQSAAFAQDMLTTFAVTRGLMNGPVKLPSAKSAVKNQVPS